MTLAVTKGFDIEWISDMDVLSFQALIDSIERVASADMLRAVYAARLAWADQKDFKKVVQDLEKASSPSRQANTDGDRLQQDIGSGF